MELVLSKKQTPIEIALDIDETGHTTAKKLYAWLDLRPGDYSRWVNQNIINNPYAENGTDYSARERKTSEEGGRPSVDYLLSASFAKKLAMSSRSLKGEETRNYFINVEKALAEVAKKSEAALTPAEMFLQNAQLMVEQERRLASIENKQEKLSDEFSQMEVSFSNSIDRMNKRIADTEERIEREYGEEHYTIMAYASLKGYGKYLETKDYSTLGKMATSLSKVRGYKISHVPSAKYVYVGVYHISILEEVFSDFFNRELNSKK